MAKMTETDDKAIFPTQWISELNSPDNADVD